MTTVQYKDNNWIVAWEIEVYFITNEATIGSNGYRGHSVFRFVEEELMEYG